MLQPRAMPASAEGTGNEGSVDGGLDLRQTGRRSGEHALAQVRQLSLPTPRGGGHGRAETPHRRRGGAEGWRVDQLDARHVRRRGDDAAGNALRAGSNRSLSAGRHAAIHRGEHRAAHEGTVRGRERQPCDRAADQGHDGLDPRAVVGRDPKALRGGRRGSVA